MDEYLCLTELLDQDLSAYEFFQTLAPMLQDQLRQEDQIRSFAELQAFAGFLHQPAAGLLYPQGGPPPGSPVPPGVFPSGRLQTGKVQRIHTPESPSCTG